MALPPSDEPYIAELKAQLVRHPEKFGYRYNSSAKRDLKRLLYRAASLNGSYIQQFFPDLSDATELIHGRADEGKDSPSSNLFQMSDEGEQPFEWIMNRSIREHQVDPSHPGRTCSRKFKKGEPTYRCLYVF
jgi:E3 ubiquitin-protein ligase UBR1